MPKKEKSENSKSALAKERKAATQAEKDQADAATKEAALAQDWNQGGKDASRKEEAERKRIEALARKRERELLLADEEKAIAAKTVTPTVKQSKPFTSTSAALRAFSPDGLPQDEFAASGLDNALDLLSITAGSSTADSAIDRHPERRMKSAWKDFESRETPLLKDAHPGLRQSQVKEKLAKLWKKSPDNPMNQQNLAYNSTADEAREVSQKVKEQKLETMRVAK